MTTATPDTLIRTPDEITGEWLSTVLERPGLEVRSSERIGTGQMSQNFRVAFGADGGGGETLVVKLASDDDTSRGTGVGMGAYYREVSFYENLAARLGDSVPGCHLAVYDPTDGWFTLVLDDVEGAHQGDQVAGCNVDEARQALDALARIQAPVMGDLSTGTADWLNQPNPLNQALLTQLWPMFRERYADWVTDEQAAMMERFLPSIDAAYADRRPPLGLVHGDYRLDNLLFAEGSCTAVDWQTVAWGPAMIDAAYFLGTGLTIEDRRAHEEELMRGYHEALLAQGVQGLSWEQCWEGYRGGVFSGIMLCVAAAIVTVQTDRGDRMFRACFERNAQQVLDLDSLDLLPEPDTSAPVALRPEPADEGTHPPGPEALWNESWYFDGISDDGTLGVYTRVGRVPNQGDCIHTTYLCGPDRPTVVLAAHHAPLPDIDDPVQAVHTDGLDAEHHCEEPLARYRVDIRGQGTSFADPGAILRDEQGEPVDVAVELTFETDGIPYAWRQATRYEIPCRVTGTVRIGEEEIAFAGPGQRDHSWGARDWWADDWMWSGLHLDDGTHTHAVGVPKMQGFGVGYVQRGEEITEVSAVTTTEEIRDDGLVGAATIASGPDPELELSVEPLAYGPILLTAPDGRVTHFVRAMCRIVAADGRSGVGWVEWNRNQG